MLKSTISAGLAIALLHHSIATKDFSFCCCTHSGIYPHLESTSTPPECGCGCIILAACAWWGDGRGTVWPHARVAQPAHNGSCQILGWPWGVSKSYQPLQTYPLTFLYPSLSHSRFPCNMRLLNTATLRLEEFTTYPPPYAILSHTWGQDEVLFKDIEDDNGHQKEGYQKIRGVCSLAASEGFRFCWIDTCCIDKSSSAEISEAINSMYRFYRKSRRCYVYLDVRVDGHTITSTELQQSRWITRGWTLQELIAPHEVHFFDKQWKFCGDRHNLVDQLHSATAIDKRMLLPNPSIPRYPEQYSVATRMSWASRRTTTRPEDIAYCLFGIFQVHLPPLYGEGRIAACRRLEEEIMKKSLDLSILAWRTEFEFTGLLISGLAEGPQAFHGCSVDFKKRARVEPFHSTNKGLHLSLPLIKARLKMGQRQYCPRGCSPYTMILPNCAMPPPEQESNIGIRIWHFKGDDVFYRAVIGDGADDIFPVSKKETKEANVQTFYLATHVSEHASDWI